jgi:putative addiction module component (TIGR02574 family)
MINFQEILKLSVAERILMMEKIWDSIERDNLEITASQKTELDRRLARYEAGRTKFFTWEEVKRDIYSAVKNESSDTL